MFDIYISVYTHPHNTSPLPRTFYQELHKLFFFFFCEKPQKKRSSQLSGRIIQRRGRTGWCVDLY